MKSIRSAQSWGVVTKVATAALSIVQTIIILRILSPAEYGVVGIVLSLGSLVGVTQYVGIVDATIREIAVTKDPVRRARVFWVSLWLRMLVTIPVSLGLALVAVWIGTRVYPMPDIPHLIQLMSIVLILQGVQGVLGGVYSGRLKFAPLYAFQFIMAVINVPVFAFFVLHRGTTGYFEAMIVTTITFIILLSLFLRPTLGSLSHPGIKDFYSVFRQIFHTGAWTYVAKILAVAWQRVPILILGRWATPETVGLFNAALTFGSKMVILASALGEVNLAYLSSSFAKGKEMFRKLARDTLGDVAVLVVLGAGFLALFAPELLRIFAGTPYVPAASATVLVTWGYALYAFLDISSNTVFVPSRRAHYRALGFAFLVIGTVGTMVLLPTDPLSAASWGILVGGGIGVFMAELLARLRIRISLMSTRLSLVAIVAVFLMIGSLLELVLPARIVLFTLLGGIVTWIGIQSIREKRIHTT